MFSLKSARQGLFRYFLLPLRNTGQAIACRKCVSLQCPEVMQETPYIVLIASDETEQTDRKNAGAVGPSHPSMERRVFAGQSPWPTQSLSHGAHAGPSCHPALLRPMGHFRAAGRGNRSRLFCTLNCSLVVLTGIRASTCEPEPKGPVHVTMLFNFLDELCRRIPN
jgi:hypothetical protein